MQFVPYKGLDPVARGEASVRAVTVLTKPVEQVVGVPHVECSVPSARQQIDVEHADEPPRVGMLITLGPRFRGDERVVREAAS